MDKILMMMYQDEKVELGKESGTFSVIPVFYAGELVAGLYDVYDSETNECLWFCTDNVYINDKLTPVQYYDSPLEAVAEYLNQFSMRLYIKEVC